ncbi:MAG TPA: ABC transporter substrate-binding protein [Streptosporangiaceae bacterium]|jgi:ABC-type nitrate/sulfonate/bicarbonate transport system substrate-binding protein|nr:ABC transporter substrate-binding protein [Streptosporangiaceae bacterium]
MKLGHGSVRRPGRARQPRWAAAGAAALALAVSACGSSGAGSSGGSGSGSGGSAWATVNVGIALSPPKVIFLGPYVAQQEGFFAREHLHVNFIGMPNGLQTELGTTAGSINFGFSSGTDSIEAAAQNAPIHAIWSYGTKLDTECIGAPGIGSARDLAGKPVGSTGTDGFSITLLQACLQPAGVSLSQVKAIDMTRSEFVPAMTAGKIYAAVFHADDAYVITHQLKGTTVLSAEYKARPQWWYGGVSMLDSYGRAHRDVVIRFLAAMMMADRWMNNPANNSALVKLGVSVTKEDEPAVAYAVSFNRSSGTWPDGTGLSPAQVSYTAGVLYTYKDISRLPSYSQIVDPSYADAALATLGSS